MNRDVLECKERAQVLKSSENPSLNVNKSTGRKIGYIQLMKQLWEERGYASLGLTGQNLRDQASKLQKIQIIPTVGCDNESYKTQEGEIAEVSGGINELRPETNLHTITIEQVPEELRNEEESSSRNLLPNLPEINVLPSQIKEKMRGKITHRELCCEVGEIYDEIVHFRRNIFKIPSGRAGKDFITELTYWLKQFNSNAELNSIALKVFMILPTLILQKPSAKSKSKEHSSAIDRRLLLWRQGDVSLLMKEVRFIQKKFKSSRKARSVEDVSKTFAKLVMQGKITAAIKMLDKESSSGLCNLSPEVIKELKQKHPTAAEVQEGSLLYGPMDYVPPNTFDLIDEQTIYNAAIKTKGSAGPSGMDAELYRRILCSKSFKTEGKLLREEIAIMTRNLLKSSYHSSLLEAFISCRLIPLDKNPGIRPIGVGEVLRRIIGKTVSAFFKEELKQAAGPLQVCAGHSAGAEAAIHAMSEIFAEDKTDGILLIDARNAFNQMNRSVAMHNIQITCNEISQYLINTYRSPSRLFICGGGEILSQEGTTQGDPLAMPWYSINTSTIIQSLRLSSPDVKQVWLADDSAGGGTIASLYSWYRSLCEEGMKYGYHVNGSKSWLIVKSQLLASEAERVFGSEVKITTEGRRHLGAVIGSTNYKEEYCNEKVNRWREEIEALSDIAKSQPHSAYVAFTKGFKSKFTYFMRTISSFEDYVNPIEEAISELFLPALFGQEEPLPEELHEVITLSPAQGGLGIPALSEEAPQQYAASTSITRPHVEAILSQCTSMPVITNEIKNEQQSIKRANANAKRERIDESLPADLLPLVKQARDKGASSWLNAIPVEEQGLTLNKEEFKDSIRMRYGMPLPDMPSHCVCGFAFSVNHALSCKRGGFVARRHDGVRDLLTTLLSRVCNNVEAEPKLIPLDNEQFRLQSTNRSPDARLDIKAGEFWARGVTSFFDVRVSHVNSQCHQNKATSDIFKEQEAEKKRKYQQRILDVEMGTFTPLVFGTNGGVGDECQKFLKHLAEKLSRKNGEDYATVITWIRTRLSFEILKSVHLCTRGSRSPFRAKDEHIDEFKLNSVTAEVF